MTLPQENSSTNSSISNDIFIQEIGTWRGFADSLREEDRELFNKMLNDCYKHRKAINAKELSPTESLLVVLILRQHKLIDRLLSSIVQNSSANSDKEYNNLTR
ncbi:MAG TPA: hypothetical protein VEL11_02055 [Candidatus Bathyarchaeia archaeon]|nr:hypothetical protein [Candidatus Bathyarchaeia archaeon]